KYGGISRYFFEIASRISRDLKEDVSIWAPLYLNEHLKNRAELPVWGMYCDPLPKTGRLMRSASSFACRARLAVTRDLQILHATYLYETYPLRPRGAKTVLTVYDMIHERFSEIFSPRDRT